MGHILDEFLVELTGWAPSHASHLVTFSAPSDDVLSAYQHMLGTGLVDGFVLANTRPGDPRPTWLLEQGVPFVAFGRIWDLPELTQWVDVDGRAGVREAVAHLRRGRATTGSPSWGGRPVPLSATTGARAGSTASRPPDLSDAVLVEEAVQDLDEATSAAARLIDRLGEGGAVVCASDLLALGVMRAARNRGLRPGADLGVVGFDDTDVAEALQLTSIRQPLREAAKAAWEVLLGPESVTGPVLLRPSSDHPIHHDPRPAGPRSAHQPPAHGGTTMRRNTRLALVATTAAALTASACGGGFEESGGAQQNTGKAGLTILIGSSGDAETNAVKEAAKAWADKTGNTAEVVVASDLNQQLGQGFAGGNPPDVFYADAGRIGDYAQAGNLFAYGDQVSSAGFLDSLAQTFTYDGKLQCAPKDFSTLALVINTDLWSKAGLTDADIPKDWAGLEAVSKKLTTGNVTGLGHQRRVRPHRRLRQAGRRLDRQRGRQDRHR